MASPPVTRPTSARAGFTSAPHFERIAKIAIITSASETVSNTTTRLVGPNHSHFAMVPSVPLRTLRADVSSPPHLVLSQQVQLTTRTEVVRVLQQRTRASPAILRGSRQRVPVEPRHAPLALFPRRAVLAGTLASVRVAGGRVSVAVALDAETLQLMGRGVGQDADVAVVAGLARQALVAGRTGALLYCAVGLPVSHLSRVQGRFFDGALDLVSVELCAE